MLEKKRFTVIRGDSGEQSKKPVVEGRLQCLFGVFALCLSKEELLITDSQKFDV